MTDQLNPRHPLYLLANKIDGHTIEESLRQVERITGKKIRKLAGDRGYRGKKEVDGTGILIPDVEYRRIS